MFRTIALTVVVLTTLPAWGDTLAWPQFRGPGASGVAKNAKPPVEVGPAKNLKWKVPVPSGLSSPIVVGDLLVLTAFEEGKLFTIAYRRADGGEAWRAEAPASEIEAYYKPSGSPAAATPASDGERIVAYFGSCGFICYDLAGKVLWKHEMPVAESQGDFGTGSSPIIVEGTVVLQRDITNGPEIIALHVATGDVKWKKKRESKCSYCTPVAWQTPEGLQIAAPGTGRMVGYDLATGEEKWFVAGMPAGPCTSPVVWNGDLYFAGWSPAGPDDPDFQMPNFDALLKQVGDDDHDNTISPDEAKGTELEAFFDNQDINKDGEIAADEWQRLLDFMSGAESSAFALTPGGEGDVTKTHVRWKHAKGLPYIASAIIYEGQYVMVKDGGIVTALNAATGKQLYQKRAVASGTYYASPVAANGNIYFTTLEDGKITVLEAGAAAPEVVAENEPLGEKVGATPAIADNTLYVRGDAHLYAFAEE
jgi:outer membrane protein assembly factor BamB